MAHLVDSRAFGIAFFAFYFLFFVSTIFVFDIRRPSIGIGSADHGFPFAYYHSHCFGGFYIWSGLLGNIVFASILSGFFGLAVAKTWQNLSSPEFRARWYL